VAAAKLDVVIVSYRSREHLRACLRSLLSDPPDQVQMGIHVVDNNSQDGTIEMLCSEFQSVQVQTLRSNVGFSAACNVAIGKSSAAYLLLLNPDTEVPAGAIDLLLRHLQSREDVGIIGPRLVLPDGTFDHASKRSFPTPLAALAHFLRFGRVRVAPSWLGQYRAPEVAEDEVGTVDAINGAFMLMRREALRDVGPLDEGYWLYMEDLDWCYRFARAGWKVLYDGSVSVTHIKHGSTGERRPARQEIAFHRGMGRFYRKFYAGRRPPLDAVIYSGIGLKLGLALVRTTFLAIARNHHCSLRGASEPGALRGAAR
jgi:GT2 family glycosyltransferase